MTGPLAALHVVEFSGLGPAPLAGQLLADMGAQVITVDRASAPADPTDVNRRGKRSVALNLKSADGLATAKRLIRNADILIEGFRPGVMERLGLGPDDCPDTLVYARMTGWGQTGPWAHTAGHDLNYLSLTGALHAMGRADQPPMPPLNLVADYGAGSMFLIFGILSAVIESVSSGKGQVVDAAMVDGVPAMMGLIHAMIAQNNWSEKREANMLDGGAPFYRVYECSCGKFLSVAALEPQFHAEFLQLAGLPEKHQATQYLKTTWAAKRTAYAAHFKTRTRDHWAGIFDGSDACVAPVLSFSEAPAHPHMAARGAFAAPGDVIQSAPAPRFSRSVPVAPVPATAVGADTDAVLAELGLTPPEIADLRAAGALT